MAITLQFLGAVGTVTGSQFLVTAGDRRIVVDCGMFQGSPDEVARNRIPFAYEPKTLDALLLTHAHFDHCGRIPALVKAGYRGPIFATGGTADLTGIVLRDAAKLQEEAESRWRRKHPDQAAAHDAELAGEVAAVENNAEMPARLRAAPAEGTTMTRFALYSMADVEQTVTQFKPVAYDTEVEVLDGVTATFRDAGHILGSSIIELKVSSMIAEPRMCPASRKVAVMPSMRVYRSVVVDGRELRHRLLDVLDRVERGAGHGHPLGGAERSLAGISASFSTAASSLASSASCAAASPDACGASGSRPLPGAWQRPAARSRPRSAVPAVA